MLFYEERNKYLNGVLQSTLDESGGSSFSFYFHFGKLGNSLMFILVLHLGHSDFSKRYYLIHERWWGGTHGNGKRITSFPFSTLSCSISQNNSFSFSDVLIEFELFCAVFIRDTAIARCVSRIEIFSFASITFQFNDAFSSSSSVTLSRAFTSSSEMNIFRLFVSSSCFLEIFDLLSWLIKLTSSHCKLVM